MKQVVLPSPVKQAAGSSRVRFGFAVTALVVGLVLFSGWMAAGRRPPKVEPDAFVAAVDLTALGSVAVQTEGRLKSLDSFAHGMMAAVTGPRRFEGQSPTFTYFDMLARPGRYAGADVVFVKNKPLRGDIADTLRREAAAHGDHAPHEGHLSLAELGPRLDAFLKWGLIAPDLLESPGVKARLDALGQDLIRSARFVQDVDIALSIVGNSGWLYQNLALVPPEGDDPFRPWHKIGEANLAGIDADLAKQVGDAWLAFQGAWKAEDAVGVNSAAATLATLLPRTNPTLYPDVERLRWESFYFHQNNFTWVWMVYLLALAALLLWFVNGWRGAGWVGGGLFALAFLLQTGALGLRWWVSGRWPNSNMFEAVTTAAWFGGVAAVVLEVVARRSAVRGLFVTTSAAASMVALMCAHFMPVQLNPNIGNMMPVLHNVWLYIHTNVIIWSYILIFMAAVSGMLYLLHRLCGGAPVHAASGLRLASVGALAGGGGAATAGAVGSGGAAGGADGAREQTSVRGDTLGRVLDGVTMDLMKLSFVMLWAGLVMGAIWADHSWGRPWGWDPKEVFALNTFLVFAVLVHVRWKARDKGLWTAVLSVAGAGVMLFNWIVINFYISGLHSYA